MIDAAAHPDRPAPTGWDRPAVRTAAELLLGTSFVVAVAAGGYAADTGHLVVVSQGAVAVFLVTVTVVLASWFRSVAAPSGSAVGDVDAEYRR